MDFKEAYKELQAGEKVRRPGWNEGVYFKINKETGHIEQCSDINRTLTSRPVLTISIKDMLAEDWETVRGMTFGEALELCKAGCLIARLGWNGKGMAVAYRKGYVDIPCNRPHGAAWGIPAGESIEVKPYLQMRCSDGSYQMWTASQTDLLENDWVETT